MEYGLKVLGSVDMVEYAGTEYTALCDKLVDELAEKAHTWAFAQ